jgi:hypothetical protein
MVKDKSKKKYSLTGRRLINKNNKIENTTTEIKSVTSDRETDSLIKLIENEKEYKALNNKTIQNKYTSNGARISDLFGTQNKGSMKAMDLVPVDDFDMNAMQSQGMHQSIPGMQQGMPQGMPGMMPQEMPYNMSQGMPQEMPYNMSQGMPGMMPQGMPYDMSQGIPGMMPQEMPQGMPGMMPQEMPQGMPGMMPQEMSQGMPGMFQGMQSNMGQQGLSNDTQQNIFMGQNTEAQTEMFANNSLIQSEQLMNQTIPTNNFSLKNLSKLQTNQFAGNSYNLRNLAKL